MRQSKRRRDYDSPWKEVITRFFPQLIQLVHPELYQLIDWTQPFQFLDTELQKISPRSETGRQTVDKLVRVALKDGGEQWVLVHIEVQSRYVPDFEERMYAYHARIWLHYRQSVVSLAILSDTNPNWRPRQYERSLAGCRVLFEFPVVKVLDFDEAELMTSENPCALMLIAFRKAQETEGQDAQRLETRHALLRLMIVEGMI